MTQVEFPVLIKYKKQFYQFMEFLEKHGVLWSSGALPTHLDIKANLLPVYIVYLMGRIGFIRESAIQDFPEYLKPKLINIDDNENLKEI